MAFGSVLRHGYQRVRGEYLEKLAYLYSFDMLLCMADYILRRIPIPLWRAAKARAASEGIALRALLLRWLEEYVNGDKPTV